MLLPIKCQWIEKNKFLVNPDGQVLPCCYLANNLWMGDTMGDSDMYEQFRLKPMREQSVMAEYEKHKADLNIKNKSIKDILTHEWFEKTLPESWEGDNCLRQCRTWCSHEE